MNDKEQARILNICLDAMAAGETATAETATACLARYPEQAAELAPMLAAAGELRAIGQYHLSETVRTQARNRLRRAQAARSRPAERAAWWRLGSSLAGARALIGIAIAMLCLALSGGIVAASQPGDLAYGIRVTAERVPIWLAPNSGARVQAELSFADRRLSDVQQLTGGTEEADPRAVNALLASEDAAAQQAGSLPNAEQAAVAARLSEQAQRLDQLSQAAQSGSTAEALRRAAAHAYRAAERAGHGRQMPRPPAEPPATAPANTPTLSPEPTLTQTPGATHTSTPAATVTGIPPTRRAINPARTQATAVRAGTAGPGPTTEPHRGTPAIQEAGPSSTPRSAGANPDPTSPGPNPTSPGPGPAATAPGPGPNPTSPGAAPTSTGPGPAATAARPGPDPTAAGGGPGRTPRAHN
jgi:hypothetical protein